MDGPAPASTQGTYHEGEHAEEQPFAQSYATERASEKPLVGEPASPVGGHVGGLDHHVPMEEQPHALSGQGHALSGQGPPAVSYGQGFAGPGQGFAGPGQAGAVASAPVQGVRLVVGKDAASVGSLFGVILLCSFILLVQSSWDCRDRGVSEGKEGGCANANVAYAVALASISMIATVAYIIQLRACASTRTNRKCVIFRKGAVTVLMLLWLVGAFLCTFDGPYTLVGNGYYSLWIGSGATVVAFGRFVVYKGLNDIYHAAGFDATL